MPDSDRTANIKAWAKVVIYGLGKWPLKLIALAWVPFLTDEERVSHRVFGVSDATDLSWRNIAWRNGVHNLTERPQVSYEQKGNTGDWTLEQEDGVQTRFRRSLDRKYVSYRRTWGEPRSDKGKREFYIGWTMNETDTMRLTFFQFRPW